MADVQNTASHMMNGYISIDGREYKLDEHGIIRGMTPEDAKQLVERRHTTWRYLTERKPVAAVPAVPVVVPVAPPPPPPTPTSLPEETPEKVAGAEKDSESGDEWPDPVDTMSLEYLQRMAQAYEVKFDKRTSKAVLIRKIHAAMYD